MADAQIQIVGASPEGPEIREVADLANSAITRDPVTGAPKVTVGGGAGGLPNVQHAQAAAQAAVDPVVVTAPAITKQGSGVVLITAFLSGTAAAAGVVTGQLARDGAALPCISAKATGGDAANTWGMAATFVDTLPDAAPHVYKLSVSSGTTTETVAANHGGIQVYELV